MSKEPVLAVDLGSSYLKVARLGEGGRVISCDLAPLSLLTAEDIKSKSRQEGLVVDALKALVSRTGSGRLESVSMLSGRSVFIRRVKVLQMSKAELDKAIRFEAKTTLPFPIGEAVLDYLVVRKFEEAGVKKQEVLIFAVPRKALDEHLGLLRRAGLEPAAVDISPFVYLRYFEKYHPEMAGRTFAYIDLGSDKTEINIFRDGNVLFNRTIADGGRSLTQAIVDDLGLGWDEAEALKKEFGHPLKLDKAGLPKGAKGEKTWAAHEAVAHLYVQLITDLKRTLEYFGSQFPEVSIEKIIIGGGPANASGLDQFLAQNLEVPVERLTQPAEVPLAPTSKLAGEGAAKNLAAWFAGCLGLAGWNAVTAKVNLALKKTGPVGLAKEKAEAVPVKPQDVAALKKAFWNVAGFLAALLVIIFGYGFYLKMEINKYDKILTGKKAELTVLQEEKKKLEEEKLGAEGRLAQYQAIFDAIRQKNLMVSEVLDDLTLILPEDMAISSLQIDTKNKTFTVSGDAANRNLLEKFLVRLEEYPMVSSYALSFIRSGSPNDYLNQSWQVTGNFR